MQSRTAALTEQLLWALADELKLERIASNSHDIKPPCRSKSCTKCRTWLQAKSFTLDAYERLRDHFRKES